jgi:hypothetical protein
MNYRSLRRKFKGRIFRWRTGMVLVGSSLDSSYLDGRSNRELCQRRHTVPANVYVDFFAAALFAAQYLFEASMMRFLPAAPSFRFGFAATAASGAARWLDDQRRFPFLARWWFPRMLQLLPCIPVFAAVPRPQAQPAVVPKLALRTETIRCLDQSDPKGDPDRPSWGICSRSLRAVGAADSARR